MKSLADPHNLWFHKGNRASANVCPEHLAIHGEDPITKFQEEQRAKCIEEREGRLQVLLQQNMTYADSRVFDICKRDVAV